MLITETALSEVKLITPHRHADERGFLAETYSCRTFAEHGIKFDFVQENHSHSKKAGTVRGLHFQAPPAAQAKLVRCAHGAIFDVVVDIRNGSRTFGQWVGAELSAETGTQMYVPAGFAHGFVTLRPDSEVIYKCSDYYAPQNEGAVVWNDPQIGIDWPLDGAPILSEKDQKAPRLADFDSPFTWEG